MKMVIVCCFVLSLSFDLFAVIPKHSAEYYEALKPEVQKAQRKGAKARIVYKVVDDEGTPVAGATVTGAWQNDYPRKTWKESFVTDSNGFFVAERKIGGRFWCKVSADGYYLSYDSVNFSWRKGVAPLVKDGKWQPYNENRTIIVKRRKNPTDMASLHYTSIAVPVTNVWLGLDLESFQWTHPYGGGKHDDMLLRFNFRKRDRYAVEWATMEVSFTNNLYGGFYILPQDSYSELKSPYCAKTNAVFSQTHTFRCEFFNKYIDTVRDGDCMIFRTRTVVDEDGNLISANYGKIYGLWEFADMIRISDVYFNPTPNDTNLEDMKTYKQSVMSR